MNEDAERELRDGAAALRRAGLRATPEELAKAVEGNALTRRGLEKLRKRLDSQVEPATTFDPSVAAQVAQHEP